MPEHRPLPEIVAFVPPDAEARLRQAVKQVRQRRLRRGGLTLGAVAVLAVGSSLTILSLGRGESHADQVATVIQTSPPPTSAAYPTPHYLPPGVSAGGPLTAGPANSPFAGSKIETFALAGRANVNTMPTDSALLVANPGGYHPASYLTYSIRPGSFGGEAPEVQAQFFTVQKITIGGHPGWSWVGLTNYGDEYVTWTDGHDSYELHCDHLHTVDGDSGVDMTQLIKMAQSVS